MARSRADRLCILSRKRSLYSTARLVEAARDQGARPLVLDTLRCALVVNSDGGSRLLYRGAEVSGLSVVIPRIGASITAWGMSVVNHLDALGVPVLNPGPAIAASRDKVRALQVLASGEVRVPRTVQAQSGPVKRLVQEVGGLPCIVKLLRGTQGVGVMLAETQAELQTMLTTFWALGQDVCLQELIAESKGRDIRALVVGDTVVGAMRRTAKKGEFRSNIHRGGEGKPLKLDRDYTRTAVRAAHLLGLEVCGVDMLEGSSGPYVLEVNSSPGFEGLEHATRKDVAGAIVRHALEFGAQRRAGTR